MEVSREPEYGFYKAYLYPPRVLGRVRRPSGAAEIVVIGNRGRLRCQTNGNPGQLLEHNPRDGFLVKLVRAGNDENIVIGRLVIEPSGCGVCTWQFNSGTPGKQEEHPVSYRLLINGTTGEQPERGKADAVLLEGRFTLQAVARDNRVVGFKKEAKATVKSCQAAETNPLFQRVEPFYPPLPNCIWWQISIQPDFRNADLRADFCPRRKMYKSDFKEGCQ